MDNNPRHLEKNELFCNRCNKYVDKHCGTILIEEELHCLECYNWLCGQWDAFGVISDRENGLISKFLFIKQFLRVVEKRLLRILPDQDFESQMIEKAWEILKSETGHILAAL